MVFQATYGRNAWSMRQILNHYPAAKKFKYFRLQTGASFSKNRTNLKTNQRFEATHQRQCWHRTWCAKQCAGYSASGFKCGVRTETNAES